jgi:hypothetical protein
LFQKSEFSRAVHHIRQGPSSTDSLYQLAQIFSDREAEDLKEAKAYHDYCLVFAMDAITKIRAQLSRTSCRISQEERDVRQTHLDTLIALVMKIVLRRQAELGERACLILRDIGTFDALKACAELYLDRVDPDRPQFVERQYFAGGDLKQRYWFLTLYLFCDC